MVSGSPSPTTITGTAAAGAQNNQDFWKNALQNGNFNSPYKQTPDTSAYYQPAAQGNAGFLDTQAKALSSLIGGGGINDPAYQTANQGAFNRAQNQAQNSIGTTDYMKNLGIQSGNVLNNIGIGNEVTGEQNAFNQDKQTASINAFMQQYQQSLKEQQEQQNQNNAMWAGLLGSAGKIGGQLLSDALE